MRLIKPSFIIILLLLTSCSSKYLAIHTDFISAENLASFHVGTPDPELYCPDYGQRLHIAWNVPCAASLAVHARIRFKNLEEIEWSFDLNEPRGIYSYVLLNKDYDNTGGILTYKVSLVNHASGGPVVVEEQYHALWTELILF